MLDRFISEFHSGGLIVSPHDLKNKFAYNSLLPKLVGLPLTLTLSLEGGGMEGGGR
jgi:hypothetical protein